MLWQQVIRTTRQALDSGALQPISTRSRLVSDGGMEFLVRVVDQLRRKRDSQLNLSGDRPPDSPGPGAAESPNPFLPYDRRLFVADAGPRHVCLLNKFPVVEHHLLIVTRQFERQESPLTLDDFAAWRRCLEQYPSLGFYNGGREAGASQRHKHLQLVPLPLGEGPLRTGPLNVPVEQLLALSPPASRGEPRRSPLPVRHAWCELPQADAHGRSLHDAYCRLLAAGELQPDAGGDLPPYNLLLTCDWMLLVPRRREAWAGISVNALGFAGALLVPDEAQLRRLELEGPIRLLQHVAFAHDAAGTFEAD
ncbi:MAG: hypothetical protein J5I93_18665 [Pirellulaceae bacterium]|nr:hypothetical protein [Pirellulaceae bacterium]